MTLFDILNIVDCEQNVKVISEDKGLLKTAISGDQDSLLKMLSKETLTKRVDFIAPREEKVLYIWLEEAKDENA